MSHGSKSKAKGISASSFFDLKAELSKQEAEFAKSKAAGKSTAIVGGVKRPDKKPTVWARQNKGVSARANRDVELEEISKPTLDSARAALERKAKIYEKLRKGKTGGLNDAQYDALLVDFDESNANTSKYYESDSNDEDESLTVPKRPMDDDPLVEYEDEFGRLRTAPRSEVPRNLRVNQEDEIDPDEDIVIRNPQNHFPIYQPSEDRVAEIAKEYSEENNPLGVHFDASKEVRAKGAGFYQFSGDEETRKLQMEELKASREETERARREMGAEDIRPGEVEGMTDGGDAGKTGRSRAMEKRKRELEERRKMVEAKRRKLKQGEEIVAIPADSKSTPPNEAKSVEESPSVPLTEMPTERVMEKSKAVDTSSDPFAALEAKSASKSQKKAKYKPNAVPNEADSFLAQLENEFLDSRKKKTN
ncbi:hypothetical protein BDN70DRAFT_934823 [Pholiota conissans]|uniref:Coiled-coil domain-containing protein 174 n=1 Tax=Pholiota conissans TaxID=109636 RepID=A0A9P5YZE8_9AGAR|nr:hypothetical protein BDN70DRAFT_934823 [Pholiota conissans]